MIIKFQILSIIPKDSRISSKFFIINKPAMFLISSNIITIYFAITQGWDIAPLLWVYWFQSVVIGIFHFIKMINLKNFKKDNFKVNNRSVGLTEKTNMSTALFFLFHYGFFHLIYLVFIITEIPIYVDEVIIIIIVCLVFFFNHLYSYIYNFKKDAEKKQNITTFMFFPYLRIIPMHLIMMIGSIFGNERNLLIFLSLKTVSDLLMHQIEHR